MSFQWDAIDERERNKKNQERELKEYLRNQQEDLKKR